MGTVSSTRIKLVTEGCLRTRSGALFPTVQEYPCHGGVLPPMAPVRQLLVPPCCFGCFRGTHGMRYVHQSGEGAGGNTLGGGVGASLWSNVIRGQWAKMMGHLQYKILWQVFLIRSNKTRSASQAGSTRRSHSVLLRTMEAEVWCTEDFPSLLLTDPLLCTYENTEVLWRGISVGCRKHATYSCYSGIKGDTGAVVRSQRARASTRTHTKALQYGPYNRNTHRFSIGGKARWSIVL